MFILKKWVPTLHVQQLSILYMHIYNITVLFNAMPVL